MVERVGEGHTCDGVAELVLGPLHTTRTFMIRSPRSGSGHTCADTCGVCRAYKAGCVAPARHA
eukprot:5808451-Prymnesium_polylepis.1